MTHKIFIVDDHQIVRDGLKLILGAQPGFEVIGDAESGQTALEAILRLNPDVVTSDIEMPGIDGIALAQQIKNKAPHIKVVMLSAHAEPHFVRNALQGGVTGYLLKINAGRDLITALNTVLSGQVYLCPEVSTVMVREYQRQVHAVPTAGTGLLSEREREILRHIADGNTTKAIALSLNLSAKTIEAHRLNIMAKLKLNSVAELTKYAIREGIAQL